MSEMDPPERHPRMTIARVWPTVSDGWRFDVQSGGNRASGNAETEARALAEAADELGLLAVRKSGQ